MAELIVMPKAGVSVETCILTRWEKAVGDAVAVGDLLFTYETDKSVFEYRSASAGILLKTLFNEDDDVPALAAVCILGKSGEDISGLLAEHRDGGPEPAAEPVNILTEESTEPPAVSQVPFIEKQTVAQGKGISPRARKLGETMGLSLLDAIVGTGPNGRVIERDVRAYAKTLTATVTTGEKTEALEAGMETVSAVTSGGQYDATELRPMSNIRKSIARAMKGSLDSTAQLSHMMAFDASVLLDLRQQMKASGREDLTAITINDMVLYGVSRVLARFPELNAHLEDSTLKLFRHVNLGIAVDTPRGLMVPTIFGAEERSLLEISQEAKRLAALCQTGSIDPALLSGASFTVTNLGGSGVEYFTPILNAPQTGILGIGSAVSRVRMVGDVMEPYRAIGMSLTYDHRAVDGAPATRFMAQMKEALEAFTMLLVG